MGQSTDALLWYGIDSGSAEDDALGEKLAEIVDVGYGDGREWMDEHGFGGQVAVVDHCSCDYPMYGLAVVGVFPDAYDKATLTARRGSPKTFDALPDVNPAWAQTIRDVLLSLGEPANSEPGWCLASMWC